MKRRDFMKFVAVAQVGAAAGIVTVKAGVERYGRSPLLEEHMIANAELKVNPPMFISDTGVDLESVMLRSVR